MTVVVAAAAGFMVALNFGPGWRAYTVQGGSMQPQYEQGDLIVTSSARSTEVTPGDIIVFVADWASEKYEHRVVHRVAAVGEINGLPVAYTRGDANLIADPQPVDLTSNVRMVRYTISSGGFWTELLAGPFVIAVMATLGAGMIGAGASTGFPAISASIRQIRRVPRRSIAQTDTLPDFRYHF